MSKKIVIIGGGVVGLCTAYYLANDGHDVSIVDQSSMDFGTSYVNAGYLTPSHIIPLAAPGVMKQGLKWMLNPASPLFIKPRFNPEFLRWAWAFNKSCTSQNVDNSIQAIKDINLLSVDLFNELRSQDEFTFQLENKGLLMLCQTEHMLEEELAIAKIATQEGLEVNEVSAAQLKEMQPRANINAIGAVHFKCDWHTTPQEFMTQMKASLKHKGVKFYANERVTDLKISEGTIKEIITEKQEIRADEFVLAAGSWSQLLSRKLGIRIPLEAGKGYRINTEQDTGITIPCILSEAKIAVTPMNGFTRFAGTMEISGINHNINPVRVNAIADAASKYYNGLVLSQKEREDAACGLRPVSPDGRPYIGRSSKCSNLVIATGHAMMGWSMAPATGKLVTQIIGDKQLSLPLDSFHPDRKF